MMRSEFTMASTHPCLPGHFPGHPVVPGVVMLDHVIAAVQAGAGVHVTGVKRCKFARPLYPERACTIEWEPKGQTVKFVCRDADGILVRGTLQATHG